ncbi:Crp/Fnr family transcriptional regulator [Methylobacterium sp. WL6]|uniref:Crp/Fnr family transcriptional regulator n=1 Tax=Methylobacterium sp. WL6 TaxID=2603901 RepID=UPI0011C7C276|nr:Crp/Fnr family transcriptional regulator [Methylobacterium sp. WL6]TXN72832.1 Crp/Fnr family transcriptional regulator [Methylobacterium sp. WL6]
MSRPQQSTVQNRLLKALPADDFARLQPHLKLVTTELRQTLITPDKPIQTLFFPESGFASIVSAGSGKVEVGLIGREGLVGGAPVLMGVDRTPLHHFVQNAGEMLAINAADLDQAIDASPLLRKLLLHYAQTLMLQTAQTAFANAAYNIDVRLARWLLMCHDRLDGDDLALTHEFLSTMLGAQRSSTTLAVQALEGHGLIRARRGRITILNRAALEAVVDEGYGLPEREYARLIESS